MTHQEHLQQLLRELFQFDCVDLDFGIYRIMNYKREAIERFITKDLPKAISDELAKGALAGQTQAAQELTTTRKKVLEALGDEALDASGILAGSYRNTKAGKEYLAAQENAKSGRSSEALETVIYNHLFSFLNRYYQDGDFISKRRYSKKERYAVPYNGEEVMLYWANHDQYYIKTGEYFTDYSWKAANGVTVHFKLTAADVEQNNVKGEKRFFLPKLGDSTWDEESKSVTIPVEFRPLTAQEAIIFGSKNQQESIIANTVANASKQRALKADPGVLAALMAEKRRTDDGDIVTHFEHHLRQYTRRNTSDFFIHKDLKGFLSRELDFYLKNEVLNLEEMEIAGLNLSEGWFQLLRLIKSIGGRIIEFLGQIEEFQKMLWEKRKFVTETFYCITVGNISEDFYAEIAECEKQWTEWKELFHIHVEQADLFTSGSRKKGRRVEFLKSHPTLVVDTRHFESAFVDHLMGSFENLDEITDGLLINSENWQALNVLTEKYQGQVKCIYIDPPYNAQSSEILYKNDYKHSSWLSLIQDRLNCSKSMLRDPFVYIVAIDEVENMRLALMLVEAFPNCEDSTISIAHNPTGQQGNNFSFTHEFAHFIYPENVNCIGLENRIDPKRESEPDIRPLRNVSSGVNHLRPSAANCFYPIYVRDGKVIGFGDVCDDDYHPRAMNIIRKDGTIEVYPIDPSNKESKWVFARDTVESIKTELSAEYNLKKNTWDVIRKKSVFRYKSLWEDKRYSANSWGSVVLNNILPNSPFTYPKSIFTLRDCIDAGLNNSIEGIVLDYFAGSGTTGHAVINLNREDGGQRKFILIEMAQYFDTVLLPRIKKITFTPEWKEGKPKRLATKEEAGRSPRIVKVIRLESYEDTLNNIAFEADASQRAMEFEDYLLQYMLKWETRKSETLLNVEKLTRPFSYNLNVHRDGETKTRAVDLPETFNYLLGLSVQKRQVLNDGGKHYLSYLGTTREGRTVAVIWRDTEGWKEKDYKHDKEFVASKKLTEGADEIYVNGDSFMPGARALEAIFKARMFAPVEG